MGWVLRLSDQVSRFTGRTNTGQKRSRWAKRIPTVLRSRSLAFFHLSYISTLAPLCTRLHPIVRGAVPGCQWLVTRGTSPAAFAFLFYTDSPTECRVYTARVIMVWHRHGGATLALTGTDLRKIDTMLTDQSVLDDAVMVRELEHMKEHKRKAEINAVGPLDEHGLIDLSWLGTHILTKIPQASASDM